MKREPERTQRDIRGKCTCTAIHCHIVCSGQQTHKHAGDESKRTDSMHKLVSELVEGGPISSRSLSTHVSSFLSGASAHHSKVQKKSHKFDGMHNSRGLGGTDNVVDHQFFPGVVRSSSIQHPVGTSHEKSGRLIVYTTHDRSD